MCFDVSIPIRLICSTDGLLCLRSPTTTSFWHIDAAGGRPHQQTQIERLEQAMEKMEMRPGRKVCEAMRGLVEEAQSSIEEQDKGPIMDLVIVAGMQRIEHYEISAYGTNIALADALGEKEVSALLNATLKEEKETDLIL